MQPNVYANDKKLHLSLVRLAQIRNYLLLVRTTPNHQLLPGLKYVKQVSK